MAFSFPAGIHKHSVRLTPLIKRLKPLYPSLPYIASALLLCLLAAAFFHKAIDFHFTDEFNSFVRAYFLLKGDLLYRDVFSHHQPIMVYLSFLIQLITHPDSLYQLVLYHRAFIIAFSLAANIFLLYRFRLRAVGFIALFETTNYFLFGGLFLAESMVSYPLVYLFCLTWSLFEKKKIAVWEYYAAGIAAWFVLFNREVYAPAALFLLLLIFHLGKARKHTLATIMLISVFSVAVLLINSWKEYYFSLITVNFSGYIPNEMGASGTKGFGIIKVFFYPLMTLFTGVWSDFRLPLIGVSLALISGFSYLLYFRLWKKALLIFLTLGLLSIRYVTPGEMFYNGFHLLPWYAVACMCVVLLLAEMRKTVLVGIMQGTVIMLTVIWVSTLASPQSYIFEKIDKNYIFHANYGRYFIVGSTIRSLAQPDDTLFIDYWDTLVFWESKLDSPYKYAMYWPVMKGFPEYSNPRREMFEKYPPDFYFTSCGSKGENTILEKEYAAQFIRLYRRDRPSCIYIHKKKYPEITEDKWQQAEALGYFREGSPAIASPDPQTSQ